MSIDIKNKITPSFDNNDNNDNKSIQSLLPNMKRVINTTDYKFMPDHDMTIKLNDQVMIYNSGTDWKIIPLIIALSYPIIYDTHTTEEAVYDVTIALCPITLRTAKFKGIFTFSTYTGITMILQEKGTDNLLPIDSGHKIDEKFLIEANKRSEVKITTLRNALILAPDMLYMITNKNIKINPIIELDYYSDNKDINGKSVSYFIHPKTLCYIIQKKKFGSNKEKIYIILGKDATKSFVTGYDTRKSGIFEYLSGNSEKLVRDEAYILPMLWCTAKIEYPNSKVLYIST